MANNHSMKTIARKPGALPLAGVRVVECGEGVAAAFATQLMALLGAEVLKVEPPQGDLVRRRGPFFEDQFDRVFACGVTCAEDIDFSFCRHIVSSDNVQRM